MKHYYDDNGNRRYYISKKISPKENKETFLKIAGYAAIGWAMFYVCMFFFLTFVRNGSMRNKMQNLQDLEYTSNAIILGELINKWVKAKPNNKELLQFQQAFIDNSIYVAGLQNDLTACKMANSDYREQKNEALYELDLIKEDLKEYDI